ncbi:MAG: hypothetical protein JW724_01795 [Candidatus Altiarchaeota archaeon]|nr:hypothetical protein [Candidatus Altiarchaeota archaeon]
MRLILLILLFALTGLAYADAGGDLAGDINKVLCIFVRLIWLVTGSLMALVIIFAGVKWLVSGEDPQARASAKTFIISAFTGLIIIFTAVPVVDYAVGGILGYEFRCGFFPEVGLGSPEEAGKKGPAAETESLLKITSAEDSDTLYEGLPDLSFGHFSLSRSLHEASASEAMFLCFEVKNSGGVPAADVETSVELHTEGSADLPEEFCKKTIKSVPAGEASNTVYVVCEMNPETVGKILAAPEKSLMNAYVDPAERILEGGVEKANNVMNDIPVQNLGVDNRCPGELPESEQTDDSLFHAGVGLPGSGVNPEKFPDSVSVLMDDTENVMLYAFWRKKELGSFLWVIKDPVSGDEIKRLEGQAKQIVPSDIFTETGEYEVSLTVTLRDDPAKTYEDEVYIKVGKVSIRAGTKKEELAETDVLDVTARLPVYFDGSESYLVGGVSRYVWDFEGSAEEGEATAEHVYTREGAFGAYLTIYDDEGNEFSRKMTVNVKPFEFFSEDPKEETEETADTGICPEGEHHITYRTLKTAPCDDVLDEACIVRDADPDDSACCPDERSCVLDGECVGHFHTADLDGDGVEGELCANSWWYDVDSNKEFCESVPSFWWVSGGEESPFGEYEDKETVECCGDDVDEVYVEANGFALCCMRGHEHINEEGMCVAPDDAPESEEPLTRELDIEVEVVL